VPVGIISISAGIARIEPWQHIAGKIRVPSIYSGVDDGDCDALTAACELLRLGNPQESKVPLRITDVIGTRRRAGDQ
jgi:hypothetical protein